MLVAILLVSGLAIAAAGSATGRTGSDTPFEHSPGPCRIDDVLTPHRGADDWARTLLDQEYALAAEDVPPDLEPIDLERVAGTGSLRAFVMDDLAEMAADARMAGSRFRVTSAYRSFAHQARTLDSLVAALGRNEAMRSAARPGHSEHQLGTTIDVEGGETWLAAEAWRYGFVLSYPPEHSPGTTCYKPEPWHLRYLGRAAAAEVMSSGLSLRAWLWGRQLDR